MRPKTILLVEDNADDEALTLRALRKNHISNDVIVARDGVEAIEYLLPSEQGREGAGPVLPAVILLDLKLPKIDGLEVLQRLRSDERTRRVPVVVLTSSKEEQDILRSYDLGANSYIQKPVDFANFMSAVSNLGLYWLLLNEQAPTPGEM
jgi:two-component system response regulator